MTQVELFAWMQTPEADQRIQSVWGTDEECSTTVPCYEWYQEQRKQAGKNPVSFVRPYPVLVSNTLSMLGNFLARDLLAMEVVLGGVLLTHRADVTSHGYPHGL